MQTFQATTIANMNDTFRRLGFGVTITSGIQEILDLSGLLKMVREYGAFSEDSDPYGEHDFGSIQWGQAKVFWKIDYYDQALEGWCDPLSPECRRILTVMLASEY